MPLWVMTTRSTDSPPSLLCRQVERFWACFPGSFPYVPWGSFCTQRLSRALTVCCLWSGATAILLPPCQQFNKPQIRTWGTSECLLISPHAKGFISLVPSFISHSKAASIAASPFPSSSWECVFHFGTGDRILASWLAIACGHHGPKLS